MNFVKINDKNFKYYLMDETNDKPVAIIFYSSLSPLEDNIGKIKEQIEELLPKKVILCECDYEASDCKELRNYIHVPAIPAVLITRRGKVYGNLAGPVSKLKYEVMVKDALFKMVEDKKKEKNDK